MKAVPANRHGIAEWIMALGVVFGVSVFFTAVFSEDFWADHGYDVAPPIVAGRPAPHRDGREKMVCTSCHVVVPPKAGPSVGVLPIVEGTPAPHADGREAMPCSNCHTIIPKGKTAAPAKAPAPRPATASLPQAVTVAMTALPPPLPPPAEMNREAHERFAEYRFQGKIVRVNSSNPQSSWGDVYMLVNDGINQPAWIDVAPYWYLQSAGCQIGPGMFVKGTAFRDAGGAGSLVYGRSITVNGDICELRNSHMVGLWDHGDATADSEEK
jgi:hypothetical protein